jgi:hypothetical protein
MHNLDSVVHKGYPKLSAWDVESHSAAYSCLHVRQAGDDPHASLRVIFTNAHLPLADKGLYAGCVNLRPNLIRLH